MRVSRRLWLQMALAAFAMPVNAQSTKAKIIIIGGGFAGAMVARLLVRYGFHVTLIEPNETYYACPLSNAVIAGFRSITEQAFDYRRLVSEGVVHIKKIARAIDRDKREVITADGISLPYDRLVMAPGIDLNFDALPGYSQAAAMIMPHAWKAGAQTTLLRDHMKAMPNGGVMGMVIPANPYRCPPGPYERASLIAWYLKHNKPRSKLILFDAKDQFSKQKLFQAAWEKNYPGLIEYVPLSKGGKVVEVRPQEKEVITEFGRHTLDVANVIPPQRAGSIAAQAGLTDRSGWCPVHADHFRSTLASDIYVIGDAAIMGAMPKSAFSAHVQAHACAALINADLKGHAAPSAKLINACYSLLTPETAISVTGVYRAQNGRLIDVESAGGVSAIEGPPDAPALEAHYAYDWFKEITSQTYG